MTVRRLNRLTSNQRYTVLGLSIVSGILGVLADCRPTGIAGVDHVLTGLTAGVVTWFGGISVWWAAGAGGALLAIAQPSGWQIWVSIAVCVVMFGIGALRESLGSVRCLAALGVCQVALHLRLRSPFGLSALIAAACMGAIVVSGVRRSSPQVRRATKVAAITLGCYVGLSVIGAATAGLIARSNIMKGVDSATSGLRAMREGRPDDASAFLQSSASSLSKARSLVRSPLTMPARLVPVLGPHVRSAERLVGSARETAQTVSGAVAGVDVSSIKVQGGVVDLTAIERLRLPLEVSRDAVVAFDNAVDASRSGWLIDPFAGRLRRLAAETERARVQASNAVEATTLAPSLLGGNGKRVWLVLFTTPAEARGLGGFPGNWAEITTDGGRISVTRRGRIVDLINGGDNKDGRIVHAPADYLARYDDYGAGKDGAPMNRMFWNNVTMSPDMPSVALAASDMYLQSGGRPVDGVIVADPYALQAVVTLTGPLALPTPEGIPTSEAMVLTPSNIVPYLLIDQYTKFAGQTGVRADALQSASDLALAALLSKDLPSPVTIARAFGEPLSGGHLVIWSLRPEDQDPITRLGIGGVMPAPTSDGLSYTINNAGPNKLDTYLERSMEYEALVDERTGQVSATATIRLTNTLPIPIPLPDDLIRNSRGYPPGTNRPWLTVYTPLQIISATADGRPQPFGLERERGWYAHDAKLAVLPGKTLTVVLTLRGTVGVEGGYSWVNRPQPLRFPNSVQVRIRFKHGTRSISYRGSLDVTKRLTP